MKNSPIPTTTSNELHPALADHSHAPSTAVPSPAVSSPADAALDGMNARTTFDSTHLHSTSYDEGGMVKAYCHDDEMMSEESLTPEKVMDIDRHVHQVGPGLVYIDMDDTVSREFIETVKNCALCLLIKSKRMVKVGRTQSFLDSMRQAELVAVNRRHYFITAGKSTKEWRSVNCQLRNIE
jgi:hypothetical protein